MSRTCILYYSAVLLLLITIVTLPVPVRLIAFALLMIPLINYFSNEDYYINEIIKEQAETIKRLQAECSEKTSAILEWMDIADRNRQELFKAQKEIKKLKNN